MRLRTAAWDVTEAWVLGGLVRRRKDKLLQVEKQRVVYSALMSSRNVVLWSILRAPS